MEYGLRWWNVGLQALKAWNDRCSIQAVFMGLRRLARAFPKETLLVSLACSGCAWSFRQSDHSLVPCSYADNWEVVSCSTGLSFAGCTGQVLALGHYSQGSKAVAWFAVGRCWVACSALAALSALTCPIAIGRLLPREMPGCPKAIGG